MEKSFRPAQAIGRVGEWWRSVVIAQRAIAIVARRRRQMPVDDYLMPDALHFACMTRVIAVTHPTLLSLDR
jgi:hypothetical protein